MKFNNNVLNVYRLHFSWVSVLQNSKEEALNTALGGDQLHLQDSGLQELSKAIIAELRHMPGNEACADCGAPGWPVILIYGYRSTSMQLHLFYEHNE